VTSIVAYVPDLMDRSRFAGVEGVTFVGRPEDLFTGDDDVVVHVADLGRPGVLEALEAAPAGARVVGYASHVDRDLIDRAEALGVEVHPRSRFFAGLPSLLA
jgi:hypothetical protein